MKQAHLANCHLGDGGVYVTFSDGMTFFLSEAFLFSARFSHGELVGAPPAQQSIQHGNERQN